MDAKIPAGDATQYAILFTDNRIQRDMLTDITKDYLLDMGLQRLGDIIAILRHAKAVHNQVCLLTSHGHSPILAVLI